MNDFFRNLMIQVLCCGCFILATQLARAQPLVRFVENKNQWTSDVHFLSRVPGGKMAIGPGSFRYFFLDRDKLQRLHEHAHDPDAESYREQQIPGHAVFVNFLGSNLDSQPKSFGKTKEYYNYFLGDDPAKWAPRAFGFEGVFYESFYQGIDLKIYSAGDNVKYDFVVEPGADPQRIQVLYQGAAYLSMVNGNLEIETPFAKILEQRPVAWQLINGKKIDVECHFVLTGNRISYSLPNGFDACYELTIDPLLIFSTYSGSTADNWGSTATPGEHGNLYSSGVTNEEDGGRFPATPGAYQVSSAGIYDISILKYDSLGGQLLYATYLGGESNESPHSLVMNNSEELVLLGSTSSTDYPTTPGAYSNTFNGGSYAQHVVEYLMGSDIIVSRLSKDGTQVLASTYFGGSLNDGLNPDDGELTRNYGDQLRGDIITDELGDIYISSVSASRDLFPGGSGFQSAYQGGETDALLLKFNAGLTELIWGTYIGGSEGDAAHSLKLDHDKNIFLAGGTASDDFPVAPGAYQEDYAGDVDGWIAKISADGSSLVTATYTGTEAYNQIYFLDLNANEEVYVYGQTSGDFPITPGVYSNPHSGQFVQKFSTDLTDLVFSTVFGAGRSIPDISPTAFLVNDCDNIFMAGWGGRVNRETAYWNSGTSGMTTTPDAFQLTTSGSDFYFIVLAEHATDRLYATFFGGTQSSTHVDGGTSRFDKDGIVYHSVCSGCRFFNDANSATSDFPTTPGAWSRVNRSGNCNNAAFKFDLSTLKARLQTYTGARDLPGIKAICFPDAIGLQNLSTGGGVFNWDFGDGTTLSTHDTSFVTHVYTKPGKYIVSLEAVDHGTCQVVDRTSVVVTVTERQSFIQDDAAICAGDTYRLQALGGITYFWTSSDVNFVSHEPDPLITPKQNTDYFITLDEPSGCIRTDTVHVKVIPAITPDFLWERLGDCAVRPEISVRSLTDSLKNDDLIFFDFGDGTTNDLMEQKHAFERDGTYNVRLVTQRDFCVFEKTVSIPVYEMFVPNIITPGKQGFNDVFTVRYGSIDGITPGDFGFRVALTIYNRWGEVVFRSDDYRYDWSGANLASGTYYYEVSIDGHATCKSWLQIIK